MKAAIQRIFLVLRKAFAVRNQRFPTPAEIDKLQAQADYAFKQAIDNNIRMFPEADELKIIESVTNQDPLLTIQQAGDRDIAARVEQRNPRATIEAIPLKDPKLKKQALEKKLQALNEQSRVNLQKSAEKQRAKVKRDKEGLESIMDQIPVRDDGPDEFSIGGRVGFSNGELASAKDFIESTGDDELMDLYIDFLDTGIDTKLIEALQRKGYQTYAGGGKVRKRRIGFSVGGGKKFINTLKQQMKSPFGRLAIRESSGALPKGIEEGSLMGDILEGVNKIQDLLGETKSVPYTRFQIADFVMNMRKDGFDNAAILDIVKNYGDKYSLSRLRERIAPQMKIAIDAGAKTKGQRDFVIEMENTKDIYTPEEFRDHIREKNWIYEMTDRMEDDLMARGLTKEQAEDITRYAGRSRDNIFDDFAEMKSQARWDHDNDPEIENIISQYEMVYEKYLMPQRTRYKNKYRGGGIVSKLIKQFNKAKKKNPKLSNEDFAQKVADAEKAEKVGMQTVEEFENLEEFKKEAFNKRKTYDELPTDKPKKKTLRLKKAEGGLSYLQGF